MISKLFGLKNKVKDELSINGLDFLNELKVHPEELAKLESELISKSMEECLNDLDKASSLGQITFKDEFNNTKEYIIILPKYEIWQVLVVAHLMAKSGKVVKVIYEKWCEKIIEKILILNHGLLHYQSLSFELIDNLSIELEKDPIVINFADNVKGVISNIPSFSTILVNKDGDIDRAIAFAYENAFNFAGLMKSNIKRIIIDKPIYDIFIERVLQRFKHLETPNTEIKSSHTTNQLELLLSEAISEGADLLIGDTNFNESQSKTILKDIDYKMRIFQKNFYGPVLQLVKANFDNTAELSLIVKSQPSKGLLVFSEAEMIFESDREMIYRKYGSQSNSILDDFPMLEFMIKKFL